MKKIVLLLNCFLSLIVLSSCYDTRIVDINNVVWKDNVFNIIATSDQLQQQNYNIPRQKDSDYYSSITVDDITYACIIYMANNGFLLYLYDDVSDIPLRFYGTEGDGFFWGEYSYSKLQKPKNCEYLYLIEINLLKTGQYFDYCTDNQIAFPQSITLFGYELK